MQAGNPYGKCRAGPVLYDTKEMRFDLKFPAPIAACTAPNPFVKQVKDISNQTARLGSVIRAHSYHNRKREFSMEQCVSTDVIKQLPQRSSPLLGREHESTN